MKTVPQVVEELISQKPFIEKALADGIVNQSALAQQLLPEIQKQLYKNISLSSVIMALKRLPSKSPKSLTINLKQYIKNIVVRSDLVDYTFLNSATLSSQHQSVFGNLTDSSSFLAVSQGSFETTILFSQSLLPFVKAAYETEKLVFRLTNLASISIHLTAKATTSAGVHYAILKALAWENINICEVISTYTELNIFIKDSDIDRAFALINRIGHSGSEN